MSSPEESRGLEYVKQAETTLAKWSFFGSSSKHEDAADLYEKAGNNFKMGKLWRQASDAYSKRAIYCEKVDSHYQAASAYVAAGDAMKQEDPPSSLSLYEKAIPLYGETGKFGSAAKVCESMGEILEKEATKQKEAMSKFQQAADYYSGEKSSSRANKCLNKVARISASAMDYPQAIAILEKLGMESLENNLLKFNAKKYFMHALFCIMARGDYVAASQSLQKYSDADYSFPDSREHRLLSELVAACEEMDGGKFSTALFQYDSMTKLDNWETDILLRVKRTLTPDEVGDLDDAADDLR